MSAPPGALRFAGYAALFDQVDRGGDVIRPGAFGAPPAGVPLLWQHRGRPVGAIERIATDSRGLCVIGRIDDARVAALVRSGALYGLSIGYRARSVVPALGRGRVRQLVAVDLVEVSLVAAPMQPRARVHRLADHAMSGAPDMGPDPRRPRVD